MIANEREVRFRVTVSSYLMQGVNESCFANETTRKNPKKERENIISKRDLYKMWQL